MGHAYTPDPTPSFHRSQVRADHCRCTACLTCRVDCDPGSVLLRFYPVSFCSTFSPSAISLAAASVTELPAHSQPPFTKISWFSTTAVSKEFSTFSSKVSQSPPGSTSFWPVSSPGKTAAFFSWSNTLALQSTGGVVTSHLLTFPGSAWNLPVNELRQGQWGPQDVQPAPLGIGTHGGKGGPSSFIYSHPD